MTYKIRHKKTGMFADGHTQSTLTGRRWRKPQWTKYGAMWHKKSGAMLYLQQLNDIKHQFRRLELSANANYLEEYLSSAEVVLFTLQEEQVFNYSPQAPTTNHLVVQCLPEHHPHYGPIVHIRVRRKDRKDGITWDELQLVKNEQGYGNRFAIEVYPPDNRVVYEINMRHLWILPEDTPLPDLFNR